MLVLAIAGASIAWPPGQASAEGLFDFLFGGFRRPAPPPQTSAYTDPNGNPLTPTDQFGGTGRSLAFCVRLCDGRYFPMQRHAAATSVQLCNGLCPASRTKVFFGSEIDRAVGADGSHYADLDHAFVYRKQLVADCTCNGRDAFGLASFDLSADPTLHPGDMVATPNGLVAYSGSRPRRGGAQAGEFTPIRNYSGLPAEFRAKLATGNASPPN